MRSFDSIQIGSEGKQRLDYIDDLLVEDESKVLLLLPPKQNNGREEIKKLMRVPFYTYEEESTLFKRYNVSDVCGFEIWYDDGEVNFYWYVPNEEQDSHYRRHLHSRYSKGQLRESTSRFLPVGEDDYFAGSEYYLKHHYFEPINHHDSPLEFTNIYEDLLSEIDTKDDSRVMIQVLYKPAESDWTELHSLTVDEHADELDHDMKQESKWFGLGSTERPLTTEEKQIPGMIRNQRDKKGYYINFRVGVFGPTAEEVEREMTAIDDIIELSFESASGQNFVPGRNTSNDLQGLVEDMLSRRPTHMRQPKLPRDYWAHRRSGVYKHIIVTASELASLAHIPNSREVNINGINWSLVDADGSLPSGAKDFEEPTDEEREQILRELQQHSSLDGKTSVDNKRSIPKTDDKDAEEEEEPE